MNLVKEITKRVLPTSVVDRLRLSVYNLRLRRIFDYDKRLFLEHYSSDDNHQNDINKINARLIYFAHSIEKGLSHESLRYGFGEKQITKLVECLMAYDGNRFTSESKAYLNALSVLRAYIAAHETAEQAIPESIQSTLRHYRSRLKQASDVGGVLEVKAADKIKNSNKNFRDLALGRASVRSYAAKKVDPNLITDAINIALKSPSACNRQSSRVYLTQDPKTITKLIKLQAGLAGYDAPSTVLVVTSDISSFVSLAERNELFVDGGLFSMSLLLALEYHGLAACPINAMFGQDLDRAVHELLDIPANERLIMFITVGYFRKAIKTPKSFRLDAEDITSFRKLTDKV